MSEGILTAIYNRQSVNLQEIKRMEYLKLHELIKKYAETRIQLSCRYHTTEQIAFTSPKKTHWEASHSLWIKEVILPS